MNILSINGTPPSPHPPSQVFRKVHLELAWRQDGMQVLHITMYPRKAFDVPIFGLDMVAFGGNVTLCIVDTHPASMSRQLPPIYGQACAMLREKYGMGQRVAQSGRDLPDWQLAISSDHVVAIRPETGTSRGGSVGERWRGKGSRRQMDGSVHGPFCLGGLGGGGGWGRMGEGGRP